MDSIPFFTRFTSTWLIWSLSKSTHRSTGASPVTVMFGPTSAVLMKLFGSAAGIALGVSVLALETVVPVLLAVRTFRRRDW